MSTANWPQLAQLPFLDPLPSRLSQQILTGTLPHACVFLGPEGGGKRTLAQALAAVLLSDPATLKTQGQICQADPRTLELLAAGQHSDYWEPRPEKTKNIRAQDLRALTEEQGASFPRLSTRKVFVLDLDVIQEQGQNILLKLSEEPPSFLYLLFTCTHAYDIIPTLTSRLTPISLPRPSMEALEAALVEETQLNPRLAHFYLAFTDRVYEKAMALAQDESLQDLRAEANAIFFNLPRAQGTYLFGPAFQFLSAHQEEVDLIMKLWETLLIDLERILLVGPEAILYHIDYAKDLEALAKELQETVSLDPAARQQTLTTWSGSQPPPISLAPQRTMDLPASPLAIPHHITKILHEFQEARFANTMFELAATEMLLDVHLAFQGVLVPTIQESYPHIKGDLPPHFA